MTNPQRLRVLCLMAVLGGLLVGGCGDDASDQAAAEATPPADAAAPAVDAAPAPKQYEKVTKRRLGPTVNTPYGETRPIASDDGDLLWLTRTDYPDPAIREAVLEQVFASRMGMCGQSAQDIEERIGRPDEVSDEMRETLAALADTLAEECERLEVERERWRERYDTDAHPPQVYKARRADDGSFEEAVRAEPPFNASREQLGTWLGRSVTSAAPDRNTLLLIGANLDTGRNTGTCRGERAFLPEKGDNIAEDFISQFGSLLSWQRLCLPIGLVRRTKDGWARENMLRTAPYNNRLLVSSAAFAPDGLNLIMAATYGSTHVEDRSRLYHSSLSLETGLWSAPVLLESLVGAWEDTEPFVGPDGRTLFFASDRPGGEGGIDLYLVRREGASWTGWGEPENLGPYINTEEDDTSLSVDESGTYAFMSSGKGKQQDIYEFHLPPNLSPAPIARIRGEIRINGAPLNEYDLENLGGGPGGIPPRGGGSGAGGGGGGSEDDARVEFFNLANGQRAGVAGVNPATGGFSGTLSLGQKYAAYVEAPGFAGIGNVLDLSNVSGPQSLDLQLDVQRLEVGAKIRLNNIYFDIDKAVLRPESETELQRLVAILGRYPAMTIKIDGHTDAQADDDYNMALSSDRANAVVAHLTGSGVSVDRLQSEGFGETQPVASNASKAGRQLNRRVEFEILSM